jgi:hypothetical protein
MTYQIWSLEAMSEKMNERRHLIDPFFDQNDRYQGGRGLHRMATFRVGIAAL